MFTKHHFAALATVVGMMGAAHADQLVTNGNFVDGETGWTISGSNYFVTGEMFRTYDGGSPTLFQTLNTNSVGEFEISFSLLPYINSMSVSFGGVEVFTASNLTDSSQNFQFIANGTGATTDLEITIYSTSIGGIDNISVIPVAAPAVPEPETMRCSWLVWV